MVVVLVACSSQKAAAGDAAGGAAGQPTGGSNGEGGGDGKSGGADTGGALNGGGAPGSGGIPFGGVAGARTVMGRPADWVGIIGTGQSLSVGWTSKAISTTQPFGNLTLADDGPDPKYPVDGTGTPKWKTVPLVEPIRTGSAGYGDSSQYPNNIWSNFHKNDVYGESPHSGMANTLSQLWRTRGEQGEYVTVHSVVGWSGQCLTYINKKPGNRSYQAALTETAVFQQLAKAGGVGYAVGGIIFTHGECDASTQDYAAGVYQLWQDYSVDVMRITGQADPPVMFVSQQSSTPAGATSSAVQMWRLGADHPGQIVCTGPKYQYAYFGDGLHLTGSAYERMGEKYGEVFDLVINQNKSWKPLEPNKVTRTGAQITIDFDVPNPPLVWDEGLLPPHQTAHSAWAKGRGFEVTDSAGTELGIASADIQGTSVVLTLNAAPAAGQTLNVGYALTQDGQGSQGGSVQGLRGQLRDSDEFVGFNGRPHEAYNYCVHFSLSAP